MTMFRHPHSCQQDFRYVVSWPSRFGPALRTFSSAQAFDGYVSELKRLGCPATSVSLSQIQAYLSRCLSSQSGAAAPARSEARTAAAAPRCATPPLSNTGINKSIGMGAANA